MVAFRDPKDNKQGSDGEKVQIVSNFFKVTKLPKFGGLYQYVVSFDPDVQSQKFKCFCLHAIEEVLGKTRCFDGMTLFLPKKLADVDTVRTVTTNSGDTITVKVSFTNQVPENSPAVVQLMNILFRR